MDFTKQYGSTDPKINELIRTLNIANTCSAVAESAGGSNIMMLVIEIMYRRNRAGSVLLDPVILTSSGKTHPLSTTQPSEFIAPMKYQVHETR